MEFSIGGMKNILHGKRDAAIELNDVLEERAEEIAEFAVILTHDRGRVTVKERDIRDALRFLKVEDDIEVPENFGSENSFNS